MKFYSRKLIKPSELNAHNTLFGGQLLKWIDEEGAIYAMSKLETDQVVTKFISEIDFINSARQGDIVEIGIALSSLGSSSITLRCEVRNVFTKKTIIKIEKIVFVHIDENGQATPHGKTKKEIEEKVSA